MGAAQDDFVAAHLPSFGHNVDGVRQPPSLAYLPTELHLQIVGQATSSFLTSKPRAARIDTFTHSSQPLRVMSFPKQKAHVRLRDGACFIVMDAIYFGNMATLV